MRIPCLLKLPYQHIAALTRPSALVNEAAHIPRRSLGFRERVCFIPGPLLGFQNCGLESLGQLRQKAGVLARHGGRLRRNVKTGISAGCVTSKDCEQDGASASTPPSMLIMAQATQTVVMLIMILFFHGADS